MEAKVPQRKKANNMILKTRNFYSGAVWMKVLYAD